MKHLEWLTTKIMDCLTVTNGFKTKASESDDLTNTTVVQDAFGYRYEIRVRMLSRIHQLSAEDSKYVDRETVTKAKTA